MRSRRPLFTLRNAFVPLFAVIASALLALPSVAPAEPTEQAFKDWTVRCQDAEQGGRCLMSQLLTNRESDEPVLLIEVGYLQEGPQPMAQITVPHGVLLPAGVLLRVDESEETGRMPYTVCDKVGCKAIARLEDKVLDAMRGGREMVAVLTSPSGDTASMTISLDGFTAALKSLKSADR